MFSVSAHLLETISHQREENQTKKPSKTISPVARRACSRFGGQRATLPLRSHHQHLLFTPLLQQRSGTHGDYIYDCLEFSPSHQMWLHPEGNRLTTNIHQEPVCQTSRNCEARFSSFKGALENLLQV